MDVRSLRFDGFESNSRLKMKLTAEKVTAKLRVARQPGTSRKQGLSSGHDYHFPIIRFSIRFSQILERKCGLDRRSSGASRSSLSRCQRKDRARFLRGPPGPQASLGSRHPGCCCVPFQSPTNSSREKRDQRALGSPRLRRLITFGGTVSDIPDRLGDAVIEKQIPSTDL
jgi:hypothetical protein